MVRVLAYCINAQEGLELTKGLDEVDEPDLWVRTMDEQTTLWIDVGEPAADRVKKACNRASAVKVYTFNTKSDVWWSQGESKFSRLDASVYRFPWENIQALALLVERTMDLSVTITGDSAYIAADKGEIEVTWEVLQSR